MIPEMGLMIGAYIAFRMFETFFRSRTNYSHRGGEIVVKVLATIPLLIAIFVSLDLLLGNRARTPMP